MAKGTEAKNKFINDIINALPEGSYVGCFDKKYYFWSEENGEPVQVALSLTCPKTNVGNINPAINTTKLNISSDIPPWETPSITDQEQKNLNELMTRLGIDF